MFYLPFWQDINCYLIDNNGFILVTEEQSQVRCACLCMHVYIYKTKVEIMETPKHMPPFTLTAPMFSHKSWMCIAQHRVVNPNRIAEGLCILHFRTSQRDSIMFRCDNITHWLLQDGFLYCNSSPEIKKAVSLLMQFVKFWKKKKTWITTYLVKRLSLFIGCSYYFVHPVYV